jgi:hypothetical protein
MNLLFLKFPFLDSVLFRTLLGSAIAWLISIILPVYMFIIGLTVLVFIDLFSGISASRKRGQTVIKSSGLRRTATKLGVYFNLLVSSLVITHLVVKPYTSVHTPIFETVAFYCALAEFKSILENTGSTLNLPLLDTLLSVLPVFKVWWEKFFPPATEITEHKDNQNTEDDTKIIQ